MQLAQRCACTHCVAADATQRSGPACDTNRIAPRALLGRRARWQHERRAYSRPQRYKSHKKPWWRSCLRARHGAVGTLAYNRVWRLLGRVRCKRRRVRANLLAAPGTSRPWSGACFSSPARWLQGERWPFCKSSLWRRRKWCDGTRQAPSC